MTRYQQCIHCIMDTTDPEISFDQQGVCNYCISFKERCLPFIDKAASGKAREYLEKKIEDIKLSGKGKAYDCIIGLSGGVDSSYVAYQVKKLGLNPLAVHFDSGWNSEIAVKNIENIVKKLNIDLFTHVCDWEEMKDLQLAFFKSSVPNCDIPTDHAFVAVLYNAALKHGIKYIISGSNLATESVLPTAWGHAAIDLKHLKDIQRKYGNLKLKKYPKIGFLKRYFYCSFIKGIKEFKILDFMEYNKNTAKKIIQDELDWKDYGGKHYESVFTKFFQSYYLPVKFGYDKRRAHLSSLVLSGQISREDALKEMKTLPYQEETLVRDKLFMAKKLGIGVDQLENIFNFPKKNHTDYKHSQLLKLLKNKKFKDWLKKIKYGS